MSSPIARRGWLCSAAGGAAIFAALLLGACGQSPAPPPPAHSKPAKPVAGEAAAKPAGFALDEVKSAMHDGSLAIELNFTQNLAGALVELGYRGGLS